MKLYYAPGTCALACWIALEWANADYEVQKVDYADPAYKKSTRSAWCRRWTSAAAAP